MRKTSNTVFIASFIGNQLYFVGCIVDEVILDKDDAVQTKLSLYIPSCNYGLEGITCRCNLLKVKSYMKKRLAKRNEICEAIDES